MNARASLIKAIGVVLLAACAAEAGMEPVYVIPGVGIKGGLHIGDKRGAVTTWKQAPLQKMQKKGAKAAFQTNEGGDVVLIRCEEPACVTDYGLQVGAQRSEVLRRYGAPRTEGKLPDGEYYEYNGIGFEMNKRGAVTGIIVFPK